ncbi:MAG: hypothetical protein IJ876_06500 [Elusimicrobiaceae bacterium]|nr:hypothetical protein [Elusimicrobiaceae bacterium]
MFRGCKSCAVLVCMGMIVSGYAAVPKKSVIKAVTTKQPVIRVKLPVYSLPSVTAPLPVCALNTSKLLKHAEPEIERQILKGSTNPAGKQLTVMTVDARLKPLAEYLQANHYKWPAYTDNEQARYLLHRIHNFMNVEDPSADVIALQRQIIRLYQHVQAPPAEQTLRAVRFFMAVQHRVPARDYIGNDTKYSAEELALGEELAFVLEAAKVPMKDNPFAKAPEIDVITDQVHIYYTLRRVSPLFEGLPEYSQDHTANFPLWTQEEYVRQREAWIEEHPFEYELAPYRERYFGLYLPNIYNQLSKTEKTALMFRTPGVWELDEHFTMHHTWYQHAVNRWWYEQGGHKPSSHCQNETALISILKYGRIPRQAPMLFTNQFGEAISFLSLSYEEQVEVLIWAWLELGLEPRQVLEIVAH